MQTTKETFFKVATDLKIPNEQTELFWTTLEKMGSDSKSTLFSKFFYYFGALIVIIAMTWFMNLSLISFGGIGLFMIAAIYAVIFTAAGMLLWRQEDFRIPAGLLITMAVSMVPLGIYGLEIQWGIWPIENPGDYNSYYTSVNGSWIYMEVGTILAGLVALWFFPFPFLTVPIYISAWFLTIDIIPFIARKEVAWEQKNWISLGMGFFLLAIGYCNDRVKKEGYAFWSYLFGTFIFWGSLSSIMWNKGEGILLIYCVICFFMMCLSILLKRRVLMVFGAIGVSLYVFHLAFEIFDNLILFPFILSFLGLTIMIIGWWYQKNCIWIEKKLIENIPPTIRKLLP